MAAVLIDLIIFIGLPILLATSGQSVKKKFRTFGKIFIYGITIIMLIVMIYPVIYQALDTDSKKETYADGFKINKYIVKLNVNQDQKVEVEEDITVDWTEEDHHGIYKFTPEWYKYTSKSGKTIRRKSKISNLRTEVPETVTPIDDHTYDLRNYPNGLNYSDYIDSYNYEVDTVKNKKRIKIGDSSVTLGLGEKDYIIKYTYDMGSDPYKGYDEFIFHAYGDFWGTEIKNPSIEVTMPKSIEKNNVHFFVDKTRKLDITGAMDYKINDNKLVASFNKDKYEDLIRRCYDKGYPYTLNKSITVDIELPDNYFDNGSYNYGSKSLSCIIVCFIIMLIAFLLWLRFGKDYEKKARVVNYMPPRDLSSAELGYIASNNYSKKLVVSLIVELAAKKMITIREDKSGHILIKGLKPSKKDKDYEQKKKEYDKKVSKLNPYEQIVIKELIKGSSEIQLNEHQTFYTVFSTIEDKLDDEYRWIINERVSYVLKYFGLTLVNVAAVLMYMSYKYFEDLSINLYNLYYLGFISVFVTLFLSIIMTRKSRYGEDMTVEVSGFKEFLDKVEKDKLEELVEKMPDYFYQILPYTYVLNLSKKWIEKFEDIKMPEKEFKDINMTVFDDITDQIYTPAPTYGGSGCSSCSSCGGGCSSCGGGCSSCGGGGSW